MRYEAFAHRGFQERGITNVVVTRTDDAGWLQAGVFLVDLWCLGIKDAFLTEMPAIDWPRKLNRIIAAEERIAIHPACARKLLEGAVAYAESLGFAAHRDFKAARRAFGSVKAVDCSETFTYGRDGKPFFMASPDADEDHVERVIRTLTARLGAKGFHYLVPVDLDGADMSAEEWLADFLSNQLIGVTSFEALGGFLTALSICPTEIPAETFMKELWGEHRPIFTGALEVITAERRIHSYRQEIAGNLAMARDTDQPLLAVGFEIDADDYDINGASEWCRGFLRVLELWPEAWQGTRQRADLRPGFEFLRAVATVDEPEGGDIPMSAGEVPDAIGRAVLALRAALRPSVAGESSSAGD